MKEDELLVKKYLVFDTNILHTVIDAVKKDLDAYKLFLDDLEVFINHQQYSLYISDSILEELTTITGIRDLDKPFQHKRLNNARINYLTISDNHVLINLLRPKFTGNIDKKTGIRNPEKADHTLLVNAVELAKAHFQDKIPVIIYSNDFEVQQVTAELPKILPKEYNFSEVISWRVGLQLLAEMLYLSKTLSLQTNLAYLLYFMLKQYNELRVERKDYFKTLDLFYNSFIEMIDLFDEKGIQTNKLRLKNTELLKKLQEHEIDLGDYQKEHVWEEENEKQLLLAIEQVKAGKIAEIDSILTKPELKQYKLLLETYSKIVSSKENKLHKYYRDWNRVINAKDGYINIEIKKRLDRDVFIALVEYEIALFRNLKLIDAHNISMELMPLLAEVQWAEGQEGKHLEKYYIIGLYLALYLDLIEEYSEIIDILKTALEEKTCQNDHIKQHVELASMILDFADICTITKQFKNSLILNIKELYYTRQWTLVWNLLLPTWKLFDETEKEQLAEILEDTYWITLEPPVRLQALWQEINEKDSITKGRKINSKLMDVDAEKIIEGSVADFLRGKHLVIDTKEVGRANIIIHVKNKCSRFGLETSTEGLDLDDVHQIEFTDETIKDYRKNPNPNEKIHHLVGIIKLQKNPDLIITNRKHDLNNFIF